MITTRTIDRLKSTNPEGPVVLIATPAYAGMHPLYVRSLLESTKELASRGYRVAHSFTIGQSLLPNAREELFGQFLAGEADYLFMVDGGVGWEATLPLRLIAFGKGLIACAVPEFDTVPPWRPHPEKMRRSEWTDPQKPTLTILDRYFEGTEAGTSLLFLRRGAALALAERYKDVAIRVGDTKTFAVFHPLVEGSARFDPDAAFFIRCKRAGITPWVSATARTSRSSMITVQGSLLG